MGNKGSKGKNGRPPVKSDSRNCAKTPNTAIDTGKSAPPPPINPNNIPPPPVMPSTKAETAGDRGDGANECTFSLNYKPSSSHVMICNCS
jgi:hypothetical protein